MDITKAQFWNTPNVAGVESFSYAALLAQLQIDIGGVSPNIGIGCLATAGSTTIPAGGRVPVPYDAVVFDDAGFLDIGGANPERMTIPDLDPPILRVVVGGSQNWSASAQGQVRSLIFTKGVNLLANGTLQIPATIVPGDANRNLAMSPPENVVAGDFFETQAFHTGGAGASVNLGAAAGWIIVVQ
jgi:hypothetical protein